MNRYDKRNLKMRVVVFVMVCVFVLFGCLGNM